MARRPPGEAPRPADVWKRIQSLPARFRAHAAPDLRAEYELRVTREPYTVSVTDGSCFVRTGPSVAPQAVVDTDAETWLAIDAGSLTGADAFLSGRLTARGNLDLAVRLQTLFEPHDRPRRPSDLEQVQVRANGVSLSAYAFGTGEPVYLLHGLGASKVSWMPVLETLGERYRVIVPDLPGHGESGKPRADYSPTYYAAVVRKLMDTMRTPEASFVGNSMGGRVSLEMAARYPKRVRAIALLDPAVPGLRWRYVMGMTRLAPAEIAALPVPIRDRWMQIAIRRMFARPDRLPAAAYRAGADEFMRVYREPRARVAFWSSLRHVVMDPPDRFWPRMRRIKHPALILWGDRDRLVPLRLGHRLAEAMPDADFEVLPDVGHVPQFEAPQTTRRALTRFLASVA